MHTTAPTEPLSSDQVALRFGISIPRLRTLRREQLTEGIDWLRDPDDERRTLFTPAGIDRLREHLGGTEAPPSPPPAKQDSATRFLEEDLEVASSPRQFPDGSVRHHPNPRVISGRRANGEIVYVRVSESRHFIPRLQDGTPMTFRARFEGDPPNWSLIGRCPRWIGRW